MMFDFNRHALINEQQVTIGDRIKILALDWNPIVVNDEIRKLMVTVRDVTELKALEQAANDQKRELDIVGQLLSVTAKKFEAFEASAREFLRSNRELISHNTGKDPKVIGELFRNMHTIKGNSRTYGLTYLTDIVHTAETAYSNLRSEADANWNASELLADLDSVEAMLLAYAHVYYAVLHRGEEGKGARGDGCWLDDAAIETIKANFGTSKLEPQLVELFDLAHSAPLPEVLENIVNSLAEMATDLGKVPPRVSFFTEAVRLKKGAYDLISDVFMHLLRNSVDHGLQKPEQRRQLGLPAQGEIEIRAVIDSAWVKLMCRDDGAGLNMQRLYEKGIEYHYWSAGDRPDPQAIAQLILVSGISTKAQVSHIAGRGVGMDAVATFLKDRGGSVRINLLAEPSFTPTGDYAFLPFATEVSLPKSLWLIANG
jgi:two-component system chemotaxis sensor kinase CheA